MIEFKKGNIFDSECEWLVNPVNCVGVMGKGLALEFKNRYPKYFEEYKHSCDLKLICTIAPFYHYCKDYFDYDKNIISFATKYHWKDASKYTDIALSLVNLKLGINENLIKSLAIPKIGCGLGGLKWEFVRELIIENLGDLNIKIEVYE